jgi:uncharacterized tellurite resistance protein B-like protein
MLANLKKILTNKPVSSRSTKDAELTSHIAAGVLLLEAAHVDDECTEEELDHVIQTLKVKFNLGNAQVQELIEIAHRERDTAVDLWEFTNHINQNFTLDEKLTVMEDVWRVIHADGKLDQHEDYFVHKLDNLLRLSHEQLINAKIKARK